MSDTGLVMSLAQATQAAEAFADFIRPACHRVDIAGSIRRGKAEVSDIEIVCEPKRTAKLDMFGDVVGWTHELEDIDQWRDVSRRDTNGHFAYGQKYMRLWWREWPIDLFCTTPDSYGLVHMIRTGPWQFSKRMMTPQRDGGLMPNFLKVRDGQVLDAVTDSPLTVQDERKLFALWRMDYAEPERRR